MSGCKGICVRYKSKPRYFEGNKKCGRCGLFIKWEGLYCPCCRQRLSSIPNSSTGRRVLRKKRGIKEIA